MRLDVSLVHGLGLKLALDDDVRFGEPLLDVPHLVLDVAGDIALHASVITAGETLLPKIGGHVLVEQFGSFGHGLAPGEHRGQYFVIHLYQREGFLGNVRAGGADGGDGVAHVQDLVLRHQVFRNHTGVALHFGKVQDAVFNDGEIRRGSHGDDARQCFSLAGIDAADERMGMGAAHGLRVQHPGKVDVGAIAGGAGHFVHAVVPNRPGADDTVLLFGLCGGGHGFPPANWYGG